MLFKKEKFQVLIGTISLYLFTHPVTIVILGFIYRVFFIYDTATSADKMWL